MFRSTNSGCFETAAYYNDEPDARRFKAVSSTLLRFLICLAEKDY